MADAGRVPALLLLDAADTFAPSRESGAWLAGDRCDARPTTVSNPSALPHNTSPTCLSASSAALTSPSRAFSRGSAAAPTARSSTSTARAIAALMPALARRIASRSARASFVAAGGGGGECCGFVGSKGGEGEEGEGRAPHGARCGMCEKPDEEGEGRVARRRSSARDCASATPR